MSQQVRANRLALGDRIGDDGRLVVAVGFTDATEDWVRVAYRDAYTPPDAIKEMMLSSGERIWIIRETNVPLVSGEPGPTKD